MTIASELRIGIITWSQDRDAATSIAFSRFAPLMAELAKRGAIAEPIPYCDDSLGHVRDQLLKLDGVLVWVNPIESGQNRSRLDALLRDVAAHGVWVSADPDIILKMGTKEVLYR